MDGITAVEYIAYNNPRKLNAVLMQQGFPPCGSLEELVGNTTDLINEDESHIDSLLEIHPDYNDIVNHYLQKNPQPKVLGIPKEISSGCDGSKSGCSGCSCKQEKPSAGQFVDGNWVQKSNADGTPSPVSQELIITALGLVAVFSLFNILK